MTSAEIIRSDHPSEAVEALIRQSLIDHNDRALGPREASPLCLIVLENGRVVGGLLASTARGYLHLDALWIEEAARGRGYGARMVRAAEAEAIQRSCIGAWLDTYSFAARPFYERLGYSVFGSLDGYANAHTRFFMSKKLGAEPTPLPRDPSS